MAVTGGLAQRCDGLRYRPRRREGKRRLGDAMPDADAARSLPALLFACARAHPGRPMLHAWREGRWAALPWGAFVQQVAAVAGGLASAGVQPGIACCWYRRTGRNS